MDTARGKREYYFQEVESYLRWGNMLQRAPSPRPNQFDLHGIAGALTRLHLGRGGLPLT